MRMPVLTGLTALVATELVTLEHEHRNDAGTCVSCGEDVPCMHVQWAWAARTMLGWPLPAAAEAAMNRA